jgi:YggT family protein
MNPIKYAMIISLTFYSYLIFIWVFGSWFPQWRYAKWFQMIAGVVEPYINVFKALNLRFGQFDFTPIVAIMALWIFRALIERI